MDVGMSMPIGHPPVWAGCAMMLILFAYPFVTLWLVGRRRDLTLLWFLLPLAAGAILAALMMLGSLRAMPKSGTSLRLIAPSAAEATAAMMWSAASAALTATFGLFKLRTRGRVVVLVVSVLIALVSWFVMTRFLHVANRAGDFWP